MIDPADGERVEGDGAARELLPGGVAIVRIERPQVRNALNTAAIEAMLDHLDALRVAEARALVLSSGDHLALCAGADVNEPLDHDGAIRRTELLMRLYDELVAFPAPTVAACHGACVGAGAELATACDMRVAGSNLRLRFPGASLELPVGPARLVTLCGLSVAKYLLLSGKEIAADQALRWGLAHRVAPAAATEQAAIDLAASAATQPAAGSAKIKAMLHALDGIEERSAAEGRGQIDWEREGSGIPRGDAS